MTVQKLDELARLWEVADDAPVASAALQLPFKPLRSSALQSLYAIHIHHSHLLFYLGR
jgi:hypothetical protein